TTQLAPVISTNSRLRRDPRVRYRKLSKTAMDRMVRMPPNMADQITTSEVGMKSAEGAEMRSGRRRLSGGDTASTQPVVILPRHCRADGGGTVNMNVEGAWRV